MGKVVIWRETILCANFETKSEKEKKRKIPAVQLFTEKCGS